MNKPVFLLFTLLISLSHFSGWCQINYQAVVRDLDGAVLSNEAVDIQIAILQDDTTIYSEEHPDINTGELGIVNIAIGTGENANMPFEEIDWSQGDFSISVSVNGEPLPTSPIHSVPVAEYAKNTLWNQNDDESISYASGNVGVNIEAPSTNLHVNGVSTFTNTSNNSSLINLLPNSGTQDTHISSFDEGNQRKWVLNLLDRSHGNGFGVFSDEIDYYVFRINTAGHGQFYRGLTLTNAFSDSEMLRFSSTASDQDAHIRSFDHNGNGQWIVNLMDRSHGNRFGIYSDVTDQYVFRILHSGQTEVHCLKILGGCDITEPFHNATNKHIDAGMVVVMTENGIELSEKSHDPRVVGVISGANGVKTGMHLSQDEMFDEGLPVAIAGRVYVKTVGPVEIGDLLVSAGDPGFAMAEKDMTRAFNRTIGKALSKPDKSGFVLMLVNIQ